MGAVSSTLPNLKWPPNKQSKKVQVRYPFTAIWDRSPPTLTIDCREFTPTFDDVLSESWKVEEEGVVLDLPPYACVSFMNTSCWHQELIPDSVGQPEGKTTRHGSFYG